MIPVQSILDMLNESLAVNATLWGTSVPNAQIRPVINSFVPNTGLTIDDLTYATFSGGSAILIPFSPQVQVLDNNSGRRGVLLKEPVGGYRWVCAVAPDVPEVVYGWCITDIDNTVLYFADVLPVPVTIQDVGNFVEVTATLAYQVEPVYGNL